jgi:glycosyltransferase involved in cell wall biosynthesis
MPKVFFDHQIFTVQKYGGVSRIFCEIAPLIDLNTNFEVRINAGFFVNEYLENCPRKVVRGLRINAHPKLQSVLLRSNHYFHSGLVALENPDIVHKTYYCKHTNRNKVRKHKTILTVYDMIAEKFYPDNTEFIKMKHLAIQEADHIICISERTREDLIELLGTPPSKLSTVYLGNSFNLVSSVSSPLVDNPYLLYVGSRQADYKNFRRFLQCFASRKNLFSNLKLVCFGSSNFSRDEVNLINELGLEENNNVLHFTGDDRLLSNLYSHAEAFVYPSLYEGFGIPPLEAMASGCPVICSNVSSIPEVVLDAGEYFDPYSIDSMGDAIERVLFSKERQSQLISNGNIRVKMFSWEKCAYETSSVYNSLLK